MRKKSTNKERGDKGKDESERTKEEANCEILVTLSLL